MLGHERERVGAGRPPVPRLVRGGELRDPFVMTRRRDEKRSRTPGSIPTISRALPSGRVRNWTPSVAVSRSSATRSEIAPAPARAAVIALESRRAPHAVVTEHPVEDGGVNVELRVAVA